MAYNLIYWSISNYVCMFFTSGLSKSVHDVSQTCLSPCQMDHRQSHRDQDAQYCQSESHQAGAGPIPAEGEPFNISFLRTTKKDR